MNAPSTRQFINTDKPMGLRADYSNYSEKHQVSDKPTSPEIITPQAWREPLQTPAYAIQPEPRESKLPSPYALIGYAFVAFFFVYGVVEMGFVMWYAFLKAIH